jgi:predicted membrane protein
VISVPLWLSAVYRLNTTIHRQTADETKNPPYLAAMQTLTTQQQPKLSVKLVVGIFFTLLGILLTLDNFGIADADRFLPYWPLLLIAIGLLKLQDRDSRIPAVFALSAGALLLLFTTDWVRFSIFDLWPVALILAGLAFVAHAFGFRAPALAAGSDSPLLCVLGVRKEAVTARNYRGGRIIAFMGGCELDLTRADMENIPAELEIIAIWGGIEIKVPEGWEVTGNVLPIMGGADIRTKAAPGGRKLIVNGVVIMAGVDIKSIPVEAI